MELEKYRGRSNVVGIVDVVLSFLAVFVAVMWVQSSCESYPTYGPPPPSDVDSAPPTPEEPQGNVSSLTRAYIHASSSTNKKNARTTNFSACHDVRNTSGLAFRDNIVTILSGEFFRVAIATKDEFATGEEMKTYQMVNAALCLPQIIAALGLLRKAKGQVESRKRELWKTGAYLVVNTVVGGGSALWRLWVGAWVGFIVGAAIRGPMMVIVGQFFFARMSSSPPQANEEGVVDLGDGQKNNSTQTDTPYAVDGKAEEAGFSFT